MKSFRQRATEGLQAGDRFTLSRCFSEADIQGFATLSRDYNPVHFDAEFAAARRFRAPVSHGLLTASLLTEIGGQIGWLASAMSFQFKQPVYAGDTITCHWVIQALDEQGRATAAISMTNEDGIIVLEGQTSGLVPGPKERAILMRMLAEGDPSNGAAGAGE
ncbi:MULTISPECIES: MaoC family dehydratase [Pseudomonas]|uniref:MaoC family dehydratase n=1 Tax=Pseudomonas TaxID=286 RepID=UPI000B35F135|nr:MULTISPECIES: MaoC family dehydratase [Pseudomonas]PMY59733.1 phenylacetic acid degradation bifunctional protein PaaZ [Pseudomonas sp. FW305-25]PMY61236.1 phenylacetic acid degradation bifunctional protein PaaZ [Pseudomonas sp. FW126-L8]PNA75778.1 phenylacetic acid degradation bifunctional protein PaaZ [Pseudomonas sp. FW305-76]